MGDVLALQDEITSRIAIALNAELIRAEARRQTESFDTLDCILRGRAAGLKPRSRGSTAEQVSWFEIPWRLDSDRRSDRVRSLNPPTLETTMQVVADRP